MPSEAQFRVQHVATVPRGYRVRTVTRAQHRVRIAFPPGRRVKGSGQVVEVLHPRNENPCPVKNPAELVLMGANPSWQIVVRSKTSHRGEEIWPATFATRKAAKKYAYSKFTEGSVLRYERTKNPAELVLMGANPSPTDAAADLYSEFHGREASGIDTYNLPDAPPATLAKLGALVELQTKRLNGWKWGVLDLSGRGINLAASPSGRQLYFVGGDQKICRGDLTRLGADNSRELCDLGDCMYIAYRTRKEQVDGIESDYQHCFGEESGRRPRLIYDQRNRKMPRLYLVGGEYHLDEASRGIVN